MRSYSSLFGHILGSHAEISGYFENHLSYHRYKDFCQLKMNVMESTGELTGGYVFDKTLHNYCTFSDRVLKNPRVKFLITVRRPEETIMSMLNLFKDREYSKYQTVDGCVRYYCERLDGIRVFINRRPEEFVFFEAERIVEDTESLLAELTHALGLTSKLDKDYQAFKYTGMPGKGDSSEYIKSGTVLNKRKTYAPFEISSSALKEADTKYSDLIRVMKLEQHKSPVIAC